ncbi:hypothetical protein MYU51_015515 [Penicillium brevicompactum]|uniref:uncharacterized protein n=1 Tax=Penicillium brevicompactum TaxID=5074 RepID=UPI00253F70C2|nr:uncharacterized protein N7506_001102 [Penicillium brevicompactum]KAJ5347849.1 hypothetical protein N7506_001102 [Penicillium brevicompactum]
MARTKLTAPGTPPNHSRLGRRKRARVDSDESDVHKFNQPHHAEPQTIATSAAQAVLSWAATVSRIEAEEMSSQIERYKHWKRAGSHHETSCRVCLQDGALYPCATCSLAFHTKCVPPGSLDEPETLYCSICVRRGWNHSPPELTPPASPVPSPIKQASVSTTLKPAASSSTALSVPRTATHQGEESTQTLPTQTPPEGSNDVLRASNDPNNTQSTPTTNAASSVGAARDIDDSASTDSRPRRKRNSRFATLPSDVDHSLAIIYSELESVATLKAEIQALKGQNTQSNQTIRMRDNTIAILRRDLDKQRSENAELVQLRANIAEQGSAKEELEELRVRNVALESELRDSKTQTAAAQELVDDWKGKLAQLLKS